MKTNFQNNTMHENAQRKQEFPNSNGMKNTTESIVMARVRRIHVLRQFMHPTLLKVYSGAVLFLTLNSMVSLANIFANIPPITTPVQVMQFATTALIRTEIFVQFVVVSIGVVCVLLIKDILHNTKQKSLFVQA